MKWKTSVSLMVALVLGLITAKVGTDMLKSSRGGAKPVRVVIAKKDFDAGHVLEATDLSMREVPADLVPATSFKELKDAVGRTIITPVVTGQTMFEGLVAAPGSAGGLQAMIPPGMRAVTVDVSESSGLAGQLVPGCRVDVIATLKKGDQSIALPIVENVRVTALSRGRGSGGKEDKNSPVRSVTLIVKPKEATKIELANSGGSKPRLVLRGNADGTSSDATVSENELRGEADPPPVAPAPPPAPVVDNNTFENTPPPAPAEPVDNRRPVQIIKGGAETTIYMDEENGTTTAGSKKPAGEEHRKVSGASSASPPRTDAR